MYFTIPAALKSESVGDQLSMNTAAESTLVAMNDEQSTLVAMNDETTSKKGRAGPDQDSQSLGPGVDVSDMEYGFLASRRESDAQSSSARASASTYDLGPPCVCLHVRASMKKAHFILALYITVSRAPTVCTTSPYS